MKSCLPRTLAACLSGLVALACADEEQYVEPPTCSLAADCGKLDLTVLTQPLGSLELAGASCEHPRSPTGGAQPEFACNCQVRKTPFVASEAPYVFSLWAGTRPGG